MNKIVTDCEYRHPSLIAWFFGQRNKENNQPQIMNAVIAWFFGQREKENDQPRIIHLQAYVPTSCWATSKALTQTKLKLKPPHELACALKFMAFIIQESMVHP